MLPRQPYTRSGMCQVIDPAGHANAGYARYDHGTDRQQMRYPHRRCFLKQVLISVIARYLTSSERRACGHHTAVRKRCQSWEREPPVRSPLTTTCRTCFLWYYPLNQHVTVGTIRHRRFPLPLRACRLPLLTQHHRHPLATHHAGAIFGCDGS
jgi:hypothetical protein